MKAPISDITEKILSDEKASDKLRDTFRNVQRERRVVVNDKNYRVKKAPSYSDIEESLEPAE